MTDPLSNRAKNTPKDFKNEFAPLGIHDPLLPSTPLGQSFLQLNSFFPLGLNPLLAGNDLSSNPIAPQDSPTPQTFQRASETSNPIEFELRTQKTPRSSESRIDNDPSTVQHLKKSTPQLNSLPKPDFSSPDLISTNTSIISPARQESAEVPKRNDINTQEEGGLRSFENSSRIESPLRKAHPHSDQPPAKNSDLKRAPSPASKLIKSGFEVIQGWLAPNHQSTEAPDPNSKALGKSSADNAVRAEMDSSHPLSDEVQRTQNSSVSSSTDFSKEPIRNEDASVSDCIVGDRQPLLNERETKIKNNHGDTRPVLESTSETVQTKEEQPRRHLSENNPSIPSVEQKQANDASDPLIAPSTNPHSSHSVIQTNPDSLLTRETEKDSVGQPVSLSLSQESLNQVNTNLALPDSGSEVSSIHDPDPLEIAQECSITPDCIHGTDVSENTDLPENTNLEDTNLEDTGDTLLQRELEHSFGACNPSTTVNNDLKSSLSDAEILDINAPDSEGAFISTQGFTTREISKETTQLKPENHPPLISAEESLLEANSPPIIQKGFPKRSSHDTKPFDSEQEKQSNSAVDQVVQRQKDESAHNPLTQVEGSVQTSSATLKQWLDEDESSSSPPVSPQTPSIPRQESMQQLGIEGSPTVSSMPSSPESKPISKNIPSDPHDSVTNARDSKVDDNSVQTNQTELAFSTPTDLQKQSLPPSADLDSPSAENCSDEIMPRSSLPSSSIQADPISQRIQDIDSLAKPGEAYIQPISEHHLQPECKPDISPKPLNSSSVKAVPSAPQRDSNVPNLVQSPNTANLSVSADNQPELTSDVFPSTATSIPMHHESALMQGESSESGSVPNLNASEECATPSVQRETGHSLEPQPFQDLGSEPSISPSKKEILASTQTSSKTSGHLQSSNEEKTSTSSNRELISDYDASSRLDSTSSTNSTTEDRLLQPQSMPTQEPEGNAIQAIAENTPSSFSQETSPENLDSSWTNPAHRPSETFFKGEHSPLPNQGRSTQTEFSDLSIDPRNQHQIDRPLTSPTNSAASESISIESHPPVENPIQPKDNISAAQSSPTGSSLADFRKSEPFVADTSALQKRSENSSEPQSVQSLQPEIPASLSIEGGEKTSHRIEPITIQGSNEAQSSIASRSDTTEHEFSDIPLDPDRLLSDSAENNPLSQTQTSRLNFKVDGGQSRINQGSSTQENLSDSATSSLQPQRDPSLEALPGNIENLNEVSSAQIMNKLNTPESQARAQAYSPSDNLPINKTQIDSSEKDINHSRLSDIDRGQLIRRSLENPEENQNRAFNPHDQESSGSILPNGKIFHNSDQSLESSAESPQTLINNDLSQTIPASTNDVPDIPHLDHSQPHIDMATDPSVSDVDANISSSQAPNIQSNSDPILENNFTSVISTEVTATSGEIPLQRQTDGFHEHQDLSQDSPSLSDSREVQKRQEDLPTSNLPTSKNSEQPVAQRSIAETTARSRSLSSSPKLMQSPSLESSLTEPSNSKLPNSVEETLDVERSALDTDNIFHHSESNFSGGKNREPDSEDMLDRQNLNAFNKVDLQAEQEDNIIAADPAHSINQPSSINRIQSAEKNAELSPFIQQASRGQFPEQDSESELNQEWNILPSSNQAPSSPTPSNNVQVSRDINIDRSENIQAKIQLKDAEPSLDHVVESRRLSDPSSLQPQQSPSPNFHSQETAASTPIAPLYPQDDCLITQQESLGQQPLGQHSLGQQPLGQQKPLGAYHTLSSPSYTNKGEFQARPEGIETGSSLAQKSSSYNSNVISRSTQNIDQETPEQWDSLETLVSTLDSSHSHPISNSFLASPTIQRSLNVAHSKAAMEWPDETASRSASFSVDAMGSGPQSIRSDEDAVILTPEGFQYGAKGAKSDTARSSVLQMKPKFNAHLSRESPPEHQDPDLDPPPITLNRSDSPAPEQSVESKDFEKNLNTLANAIYRQLRQRLEVERERHGRSSAGRLPW